MEEELLCSYWNRHFGHRFDLPIHNASAKAVILGLTESICLSIYHYNILYGIASDQGIPPHSK